MKDLIELYIKEYDSWKDLEPGRIAAISSTAMKPLEMAATRLIPTGVSDKVCEALGEVISCVMWGSEQLFTDEQVIAELKKHDPSIISIDEVRNSENIEAMNLAALEFIKSNYRVSGVQGAATGSLGLAGLPANIPALFTIVFRILSQIATCYGFDPRRPEEKDFMLKILAVSATTRKKDKQVAVGELEVSSSYLKSQFSKVGTVVALKQAQVELLKKTWKAMGDKHGLIMLKKFLRTIGINLTKKKALLAIPFISAVICGSFDLLYVRDVGKVANLLYRQRRIDTQGLEVLKVKYTVLEEPDIPVQVPDLESPIMETEILSADEAIPATKTLEPSTRLMVAIFARIGLADGNFDSDEKAFVINSVTNLGETLTPEDLDVIVSEVSGSSLDQLLENSPSQDECFWEAIVLSSMILASVDGEVHPAELAEIKGVAKHAGIGKERMVTLIQQALKVIKENSAVG